MPASLFLLLLALLSLGCASSPTVSVPRTTTAPTSAPVEAPAPKARAWSVTLRPLAESGRVHVRIVSPTVTTWSLPPVAEAIVKSDHQVAYEVPPSEASPCTFELTPNHAVFCGAAVIARPESDATRTIELRMESSDGFYPRAASSFGIGPKLTINARFDELQRAGFLFGEVHHARFDAAVGQDHAAWLGYFSFDPRWVAAEAAGVRTGADRWLGIRRPKDDPSVGLLLSSIPDTSQNVAIRPLFRGALVQAGPSATWSARARIDLTRQLVQRTVGGLLTVDHPEARWWFDEGVAHGVAIRVLQDVGVLTHDEVAREVSVLLAQEVLEDAGPKRSAVRGALLALAQGDALQPTLRRMVKTRGDGGARASALEIFVTDATLRAAFTEDQPIPLSAEHIAPCVALTRRKVHRFELGFVVADDVITSASGAAARAGVRSGDRIVQQHHIDGRSDVPVRLTLERNGETRRVEYHPRGPSHLARAAVVHATRGACRDAS